MRKESNIYIRSCHPTPPHPTQYLHRCNGHFHHLIFLLVQVHLSVSVLSTAGGTKISEIEWFPLFEEWVFVLGSFVFKDEARFLLNGYISNQNRNAENPHVLHENPLYLTKVDVRCTVSRKNCRRFFFEETNTEENYQIF